MAEAVIHTGDGGKRRRHIWKPVLQAFIVVVIIGAALLAGAALKTWQNRNKVVPPQQAALVAQDKALKGDLDAAQADIDKTLERTDLSNADKYTLYYQKGTNFQNEGKNREALDNFKKAETFQQTYSLYNSMGSVAEALGEIQAAIDYYQKAIPLVGAPPANMSAKEDKQSLEIKIEQLRKQL